MPPLIHHQKLPALRLLWYGVGYRRPPSLVPCYPTSELKITKTPGDFESALGRRGSCSNGSSIRRFFSYISSSLPPLRSWQVSKNIYLQFTPTAGFSTEVYLGVTAELPQVARKSPIAQSPFFNFPFSPSLLHSWSFTIGQCLPE
jgi:hypothetical protein